jgi:hypothetical protein
MAASKVNTAPVETKNQESAASNDEWNTEQVGFPPYFSVENDGDSFTGKLMYLDETDPSFPRYVFQCVGKPILCHRGSKTTGQEDVMVEPGQMFSASEYAGIARNRMAVFVGFVIKVTRIRSRSLPVPKGEPPRTFIDFDVKSLAKDKPQIDARRVRMMMAKKQSVQLSASSEDSEIGFTPDSFF